jgi:hypothetical protein
MLEDAFIIIVLTIAVLLSVILPIRYVHRRFVRIKRSLSEKQKECSNLFLSNRDLKRDLRESRASLSDVTEKWQKAQHELEGITERVKSDLTNILESNLKSMPWLAGVMSDFLTYEYEVEAKKREWGFSIKRHNEIEKIRVIRADAQQQIKDAKTAIYQLEYLRNLYPAIDDVLETDYKDLNFLAGKIPEVDPIRNYISKEEYVQMSASERNQLALDRYVTSRKKSKWQIGRDYEMAVAWEFFRDGYEVDNYGAYMRLEDLGRDVIAKKGNRILIIQCKYWSKQKEIHEKHIFQLYGTTVAYKIEHNLLKSNDLLAEKVLGVFVTSTSLSKVARKAAEFLGIIVRENHEISGCPLIKCNIGHDEAGASTKIYHLPMDDQYDRTKIIKYGEFYAFTVAEAESAGFRRAYRWHGN